MPRLPRISLAGLPLHVIQRGNNRAACFFEADDYAAYRYWLQRYAQELGIRIHAYVLMTNHAHMLLSAPQTAAVSRLMQSLGRRYVRRVNHRHSRSGTLWEGRFRACAIHAEAYLLACMRYIELNPVRAGIVRVPGDYPHSSFRRNAHGQDNDLVSEHPVYTALQANPLERQAAYRAMFRAALGEDVIAQIRAATASGYLLSGEQFRIEAEAAQARRLGPALRGRPRKRRRGLVGEQADTCL